MKLRSLAVVAMLCFLSASSHAQTRENPERIKIDGRDWARGILHAQLAIPVSAGPLTLYFPKWIPGCHRPEGKIVDLAGLVMRANGQRVAWSRDTLDNFVFHCDIPAGAATLDVQLDALNASTATDLGFFDWNNLVLYPAGQPVARLYVRPSVRLPVGWTSATALDSVSTSTDGTGYATVSLETLVDSPVLAGAHFRRLDLGNCLGAPVEADFYCSSAEGLEFKPEFATKMRALMREAGALYGARHFNRYKFLVALGDLPDDITLEHHECQAYQARERALLDIHSAPTQLEDLSHELSHSWCGKYRRPQGLAFTDFQHPENSELLWVYEGLDQYLGYVLNGRCGLFSATNARQQFVHTAAVEAVRSGRKWRPLRDTAIDNGPLRDATAAWTSWRRTQDYYLEGALIWLEADATIRRLSSGKKSLDDFCRLFLGGTNSGAAVNPYSEDQVVAALTAVQPFEWKRFLDERLDGIDTPEPARSLAATGWKVVFADSTDDAENESASLYHGVDLRYSLGLSMKEGGGITDVRPGSPADSAGLAPGMKVTGINGRGYDKDALDAALKAGLKSTEPMELLVTWGETYRVLKLDYHGGDRHPTGERIKGQPDFMTSLLRAKMPAEPPVRPTASSH